MKRSGLKIYTVLGLDGSEICQPMDDDDYETITVLIDGEPRAATWKPLEMRMVGEDEYGRKLSRSDCPAYLDHALIFRPAAVLALGVLLRAHGELLPLRCEGADLWMFNPRVVDALDEQASTIVRFDDGAVMAIRRHVFRPERLRGVHAFKIPRIRASATYLSQEFVDAWYAAGLQGIEFTLEWAEE